MRARQGALRVINFWLMRRQTSRAIDCSLYWPGAGLCRSAFLTDWLVPAESHTRAPFARSIIKTHNAAADITLSVYARRTNNTYTLGREKKTERESLTQSLGARWKGEQNKLSLSAVHKGEKIIIQRQSLFIYIYMHLYRCWLQNECVCWRASERISFSSMRVKRLLTPLRLMLI